MNIKNRKDQTEEERGRGKEEDVGKNKRMTKESGVVDTCTEMREKIHDTRQTQGDEEISIFTSGWYREKGNVIGLCIRPKRRRIFGLYRQIHTDICLTAV